MRIRMAASIYDLAMGNEIRLPAEITVTARRAVAEFVANRANVTAAAKELGVSQPWLQRFLSNAHQQPTIGLLWKIHAKTGVGFDQMLGLATSGGVAGHIAAERAAILKEVAALVTAATKRGSSPPPAETPEPPSIIRKVTR